MQALDRSDVLFAWIDDLTAFGTLWELGYAAARNKRVIAGIKRGLNASELWLALAAERRLISLVESPIEHRLLSGLRFWFRELDPGNGCWRCGELRLEPQYPALGGKYRPDFAVFRDGADWKIAIECDGHRWHEKTPDQAQRDKERDRALVYDGWTLLRFTGREIQRSLQRCCSDILDMAAKLSEKK
jgi:very-short-patch-repair endonuclease